MNMRKVMFQCVAVLLASRWMVQAAETVLSFAGTSSYVDLAMPDVLQRPSNSPMTVEGWMYLCAVDTRDMLYSKNNGRSSNGYTHMFGFYENGRIAAFTGSAWREPSPAVTAALGRWMHVAFSFDGTTLTYYLDGEPIGTSAFNYNNVEANTVKLGGYISGTDIDGMKSEVRVWDHARSHAEIARDWRRRLVGHEPGLIGYWPLNEGEGMNVYDCTGNQSTGTLVNAAWTQADDLDLSPFALVNPATGSRRFTNTNVVDMLDLMFPWGASHYQISLSAGAASIDPEGWIPTNQPPPAQIVFPMPAADTNLEIHVWCTNVNASLPPVRLHGSIFYTTAAPNAVVIPPQTRHLVEGFSTVVFTAEELDAGSTGGTADGRGLAVHARLASSTADTTPEAPEVTLASTGSAEVVLTVVNEAGNQATATCMVTLVEGELRTWTGLAGDALASTAGNWLPATAPITGNSVRFDAASSSNCTWDLDIVLASWTQTAEYNGLVTFATVYPGQGTFTNLVIGGDVLLQGGAWTHPANSGGATEVERLSLTVAGDFTFGPAAMINLDGKGYAAVSGPGAGTSAWGGYSASHGGSGAFNPTDSGTYGSVTRPVSLGSGAVGRGGGALSLIVGGTATIDGMISAQGVNHVTSYTDRYCHGAGGSILIEAGGFAGEGTIRSGIDITKACWNGSGGGRIALIAGGATDFVGLKLMANTHTQTRNNGGRAGTIYLETPTSKRLIVDQRNIGTASANHTDLPARLAASDPHPAYGGELEDVVLIATNGAFIGLTQDLRLGDVATLDGRLSLNGWTLYVKADEPAGFPASRGGGTVALPGVIHTFLNGDTLTRDGRLFWSGSNVTWRVASVAHPAAGGSVSLNGGAAESFFSPGSVVTFTATPSTDCTFIHWDGDVPAGTSSPENPLQLAPLAGNITLRAWFREEDAPLSTNTWVATPSSDDWFDPLNWSLMAPPVAGQTVIVPTGQSLRLTNATPSLATFELASGSTLTFEGWNSALAADEIVIAGTVTHLPQTVTEPDPVTGEWIPQHRILLRGSNFTLTATGSLNADYKGYPTQAGPGRAVRGSGWGIGGGGGYGGTGSSAFDGQMPGPVYGDPADPWQPGSGGGLKTSGGAEGGGAVCIEMQGLAHVDGTISACGRDGAYNVHGAASGGGITIRCRTFQGAASGLVRVDGGRGDHVAGCGGGGRIALHYEPTAQAALPVPQVRFSAYAWPTSLTRYTDENSWTVKAEMGTLYLSDLALLRGSSDGAVLLERQRYWHTRLVIGNEITSWSPTSLIISNCVIGLPAGFELNVGADLLMGCDRTLSPLKGTVECGLHLYPAATNALYGFRLLAGRDLLIGPDCWIYPHAKDGSLAIVGLRVGRNVHVAEGGGLNADERGYGPQSDNRNGLGAGPNSDSGGSYGGRGGGSAQGQTYGLAALPLEPGSPGGWRGRGNFTTSAKAGGAIHLLAGGHMQIDGLLTAKGGDGWYYRGTAGSGGSIFLAAMRFSGHGTLQTRGGGRATGSDGDGRQGTRRAPGGGGRIAVWHHLPLPVVEARIAARDVSGLFHFDSCAAFSGALDAGVTSSLLANQAEEGTKGFYTLGATLIFLR